MNRPRRQRNGDRYQIFRRIEDAVNRRSIVELIMMNSRQRELQGLCRERGHGVHLVNLPQ